MRNIWLIIILLIANQAISQQMTTGLLPELIISKSVLKNWRFTSKIATMQGIQENSGGGDLTYSHLQSDIQIFMGNNFRPRWNAAFGYHYLFTDRHANRFIQQVTFVHSGRRLRIGHRGRVDETFFDGDSPVFRIRYRVAFEIPLAGFTLDPQEFYILTSNEPIARVNQGSINFENRLGAAIGRQLLNENKLEIGIDYRTRFISSNTFSHLAIMRISWFVNF